MVATTDGVTSVPKLMGAAEPSIALLFYCASSIAMTLMNKYVLSGHKFHLNFFLLMVQVPFFGIAWVNGQVYCDSDLSPRLQQSKAPEVSLAQLQGRGCV